MVDCVVVFTRPLLSSSITAVTCSLLMYFKNTISLREVMLDINFEPGSSVLYLTDLRGTMLASCCIPQNLSLLAHLDILTDIRLGLGYQALN